MSFNTTQQVENVYSSLETIVIIVVAMGVALGFPSIVRIVEMWYRKRYIEWLAQTLREGALAEALASLVGELRELISEVLEYETVSAREAAPRSMARVVGRKGACALALIIAVFAAILALLLLRVIGL